MNSTHSGFVSAWLRMSSAPWFYKNAHAGFCTKFVVSIYPVFYFSICAKYIITFWENDIGNFIEIWSMLGELSFMFPPLFSFLDSIVICSFIDLLISITNTLKYVVGFCNKFKDLVVSVFLFQFVWVYGLFRFDKIFVMVLFFYKLSPHYKLILKIFMVQFLT